MINCEFNLIKGGWVAIIELGNGKVVSEKFRELNDAGRWANAYCEGYVEGLKETLSQMEGILKT